MKRIYSVGLVLVGIALGCAASAVRPVSQGLAQPGSGLWECFVVDRFPDPEDARSWGPAVDLTQGLNRVASHVASGTVLAVSPKSGSGSYASVTCVKY